MRARCDLIETFSSFLQFEADRVSGWTNDRRLQRSMQRCLDQSATNQGATNQGAANQDTMETEPEKYWAIHWHRHWQPEATGQLQRLAGAHLLAYLQEPCYWVAYKATTRFTSAQYGLSDCFQIAIAQLNKVLKGFNSDQGYDLKNYASATFRSFIRDYLRQRREVDICTDWSLLRKVSQKRLTAALATQGYTPSDIEPYVLAWQAYQLVYVPTRSTGSRRLEAPDEEVWSAIAQQYNTERHGLQNPQTVTAKEIETRMGTAAKAVRRFLYPDAVSANAVRPGQDSGEFIDSFTDDEQASPMGTLMAAEAYSQRQQQYAQLGDVLSAAIDQLDADNQSLIQLYYGDTLTQKEIATQLGIKQYAISRRLTRIKKALVKSLATWSIEILHIEPSPDLLTQSSAALEAWLTRRYGTAAKS